VDVGSTIVTGAGNLKARYIVHVVCPVWAGGDKGELALLGECVINA
jgi:Predicted phosphatase homologous to the C-terminal domain of histone macroH2A1